MKAGIQFRVVTAFMAAWVAASGVCPGVPYDVYIVGQITDASTGAAIPDAYVEAMASGFPGGATSSHTDASGVCVLQPLAGSGYLYTIRAGARNHAAAVAEIYCPPGPVATYSVYLALSPVDGKPSLQASIYSSIVALKLPRIYGKATLTMLDSRALIIVPIITVKVMIHLSDFAMSDDHCLFVL